MDTTTLRQQVLDALQPHRAALVHAPRQLIAHDYPEEVERLEFTVFPYSFTIGWPIRAFFLDRDRTLLRMLGRGDRHSTPPHHP